MMIEPQSQLEPRYSIIIPAYNEALELPATLCAMREAMSDQVMPGEIIVVDNNSSDHTSQVASAHSVNKVVFEPINQIARARNKGAAASKGQYLIFVDADTRINTSLLRQSLEILESGQYVGGGSVVRFEEATNLIGRATIGLWEQISKLTKTAAGSYLFCRRDAFEGAGGFDERLYASEELRMSRLLKKWGRCRNLRFEIIHTAPAKTSARKLKWYSGPQVLGWVLFMMVFPIAVRWRKLCGFWYQRPEVLTK
ncbi:MAG: glycosyltransferase [Verrucomicrobiota bacterium]